MPHSYIASKPAPNPQLSGFLTWTESNFAAILADSNEIADLAGIDRANKLDVIYRPSPLNLRQVISLPAGNMNCQPQTMTQLCKIEQYYSSVIWRWRKSCNLTEVILSLAVSPTLRIQNPGGGIPT